MGTEPTAVLLAGCLFAPSFLLSWNCCSLFCARHPRPVSPGTVLLFQRWAACGACRGI